MGRLQDLIVYTLDANLETELDISGHKISAWVDYEIKNNKLADKAKMFISLCKQKGTVYSLETFVELVNLNEIDIDNTWVYITNKQCHTLVFNYIKEKTKIELQNLSFILNERDKIWIEQGNWEPKLGEISSSIVFAKGRIVIVTTPLEYLPIITFPSTIISKLFLNKYREELGICRNFL